MKIKILEHNYSGTPKFSYLGVRSILEVDIKDKLKFIVLPVGVGAVNNPWDLNYVPEIANDLLIFHDGGPGVSINDYSLNAGRLPYQPFVDRGSQYAYTLSMYDAYWLFRDTDPLAAARGGWTGETPFNYFSGDTVLGWKASLEQQGATPETKGYAYVNWTEDSKTEFWQFDGYTGPPGWSGRFFRTLEDYDNMQKAIAKHFSGGIDYNTGEFANGIRHYFPGITFGIYGLPYWWRHDYMAYGDYSKTMQEIDTVADILVNRAPDLLDAVQMLMPSLYSVVNSPTIHRCKTAQAVILCRKINEKRAQQGKSPLQIIPFISPYYWTIQTGGPYMTYRWSVGGNSFLAAKYNILLVRYEYIPPFTTLNSKELDFSTIEPAIEEGADGAYIWLGQSYRLKQIAGRDLRSSCPPFGNCYEDQVQSYPKLKADGTPDLDAQGNFQWDGAWKKGPDGEPTPWSEKDLWRQSFSAELNFLAGVCMGKYTNRWWWKEDIKGTTAHTPPEWLPLKGRERFGFGNQPAGPSGTSSEQTIQRVDALMTGHVFRIIDVWKNTWNRLRHGKK